jgi:probable rRNA maturation factor
MSSNDPETDDPDNRSHNAAAELRPVLVNRQRSVSADWSGFRAYLSDLQSRVAKKTFSVCLVSDRAMRRYNRDFRQQDKTTDVLSFPLEDDPENLGDIIIAVPTAQENASSYGLTLNDELKVLALHGVLHLMGHDHETDRGQMSRLERQWSLRLGLPAALTARAREISMQPPFFRASAGRHR